MKSIIFALTALIGFKALATVDVQGEATIIVQDYHSGEDYFLQTVPTDFCVGIPAYTLATAITQPVVIKANYGCGGGMVFDSQINAATCAQISAQEVANADGSYNSRTVSISVNLSNCGEKASSQKFVEALTRAVYKTYNDSGYQITQFTQK